MATPPYSFFSNENHTEGNHESVAELSCPVDKMEFGFSIVLPQNVVLAGIKREWSGCTFALSVFMGKTGLILGKDHEKKKLKIRDEGGAAATTRNNSVVVVFSL
ncbi:hypothetical protein L195_g047576, partial [Trifolium pratense]